MSTILNIHHTSGSLAGRSQRIAIQEGQALRLGRAPENDIKFSDTQDDSVSGHHAELILQGGRLFVEDKKSSNGTYVDGAPCPPFQKVEVPAGATLRLAKEGPEMKVAVEAAATVAAVPAATTTTAAPPKESVGRTTLLSEIDRARQEERKVVAGEIAKTKKSTGLWVSLGLVLVLLLAAGGIGGAAWLNHRRQAAADAKLLQQQAQAKAELEAKLGQQQAAMNADKTRWAQIEESGSRAVVLIHSKLFLRFVAPDGYHTGKVLFDVYGSGVLIRPGTILTALHVVEPWKFSLPEGWQAAEKPQYDPLEVQYQGQQPINAVFNSGSREYDLALLQVQVTDAPPVALGTSNDDIKVTDNIAVIGYPGEANVYPYPVLNRSSSGERVQTVETVVPTFVHGAVSQSLNIPGTDHTSDFLYFNPVVAQRTSGGPVFNAKGELIGIVGQKFTGRGQLFTIDRRDYHAVAKIVDTTSRAVPIDHIHKFLHDHGIG